jgi:hypothetical protein
MRRLAVLALAAAACESISSVGFDDNADVAGEYSVSISNGKNGCALESWQEGSTSSNIPVTIAQTGTSVTASVGGAAGLLLALGYGSAKYDGAVTGHRLEATLFGTASKRTGNCVYTMKSVIRADAQGDFLTGTVTHQPAPNGNPDCAAVTCMSQQSFNGNRPPRK